MAFDEGLAERLREALSHREDVVEKRMFGGLAFMVGGHMCVGTLGDALMARVGADAYAAALELPHAREMTFTGKALTGFIQVDPEGFSEDKDLHDWIDRCETFVDSLPPK